MASSPEEEEFVRALRENQNNANQQSMLNTVNLRKFFGPKLDELTKSINAASAGSSFLSKVIIGVTITGTIIAGLQMYSSYITKPDFSKLSDENLKCVMALAKDQNQQVTGIALEICARKLIQKVE